MCARYILNAVGVMSIDWQWVLFDLKCCFSNCVTKWMTINDFQLVGIYCVVLGESVIPCGDANQICKILPF